MGFVLYTYVRWGVHIMQGLQVPGLGILRCNGHEGNNTGLALRSFELLFCTHNACSQASQTKIWQTSRAHSLSLRLAVGERLNRACYDRYTWNPFSSPDTPKTSPYLLAFRQLEAARSQIQRALAGLRHPKGSSAPRVPGKELLPRTRHHLGF